MARKFRPETDDASEIELAAAGWYRDRLSEPASPPEDFRWKPILLGPTWKVDDAGHWILPDLTLGWQVLGWCSTWLQAGIDEPWEFTLEQARFVLWWYAVDEFGRFLFRDGVLQRLKGWGKDPLGAAILAAELVGPCRFGHFDGRGEPVAVDEPKAWVQTAAVALEQTKNTMRLFPSLFSVDAEEHYGLQVLKRTVHAMGDTRVMEAVTSSPATLEGARATFLLLNETHHWDSSNDGHEMAATIRRNAAKSPKGAARTLRITNAYDPSQDSVAQQDREAWEKAEAGGSRTTGILYDSIEAAAEAPLTEEAAPEVVRSIRGDSIWLSEFRIVQEILDTRNPPSQSRRYWYNQITAHEEAWITPQQWDACQGPARTLAEGDRIVLFFDGSKTEDATGLVACRLEDGHVFTLGCWQRPPNVDEWSVPRQAVSDVVDDAFAKYDPRAFFADPGMGEDESGERYWDAFVDRWANEYGEGLDIWAMQTGLRRHAVLWEMTNPSHVALFTESCERTLADTVSKTLTHDADPRMRDHVRNARRRPNRYGVSIGKEHRDSLRKVDLAVCMVGVRMLLRAWQALPESKRRKKRSGAAVFF